MLSAVVIEDSEPARLDLMDMLNTYCPTVKVTDWAENSAQAFALLEKGLPDLLFLDLDLGGVKILELVSQGQLSGTSVIIVTGNPMVNKEHVRPETVAYLSKPVNPTELIKAVKQAEQHKSLTKAGAPEFKLKISNKDGQHLIPLTNILKLVAQNNRTFVYTDLEKVPIQTSKTLKTFEFLEEEYSFCRIHHSHLVNLDHVRRYHLIDGGRAVLSDGSSLSISRQNLDKFLQRIDQHVLDG